MGTVSASGEDYDPPNVPEKWQDKQKYAQAFLNGFNSGIWGKATDKPSSFRYETPGLQKAFVQGFQEAQKARADRGDQ